MAFWDFGMKKIGLLVALGACVVAHAEDLTQKKDDRRIQDQSVLPNPPILPAPAPVVPEKPSTVEVSEADLVNNPELLTRALVSSLILNEPTNTQILLPLYLKLDVQDPDIVAWAQAADALARGDLSQSIARYTDLLTKTDSPVLRARLLEVQFLARQFAEVQDNYDKLPDNIRVHFAKHIEYIKYKSKLKPRLGFDYLEDKNINNAPNAELPKGWKGEKPKSAHGIAVNTGLSKTIFLPDGYTLEPDINLNVRHYWDADYYDEISARTSFGIGKQMGEYALSISPFYERTHYAGGREPKAGEKTKLSAFSQSGGASFYVGRPIASTYLGVQGEVSQNFYHTRTHLNGHSVSLSPTLQFNLGGQNFGLGIDYQRNKTRAKDDSFHRTGVRLSTQKAWQNGFVGNASLSMAQRTYDAPMFFGLQINREYNANVGLGHQKIAWRGIMPRLTWQYSRVNSTIALYNYEKQRVFVELRGSF